MKMLEGPYHDGWGVTISMPQRLGAHHTVTTVTIIGDKDTVEGLAAYLTDASVEPAKPMLAGAVAKHPLSDVR